MPTVKDIVVSQPTAEQETTCNTWPLWRHDPDTFEWTYTDKETCLVRQGHVSIADQTDSITFQAGDMVIFPKGLVCTWTIHETVVKNFSFG
jgi:uncharacterized cupin superfamily protein